MKTTIQIENLKCGGCASTIKKGVLAVDEVTVVDVNVEDDTVIFEATADVTDKVKVALSKMGYPEVGNPNTLLHKAKSYVSCATGKMNS